MSDHRDELAAYAEATSPTPARRTRLEARLEASLRAPTRRGPVAGFVLTGALAIAAAAAVLLWPRPTPVHTGFDGAGVALLGDVTLRYDGAGDITGDTRNIAIDWRTGALDVDVTPHAGITLAVHTGEAHVRVVGTRFIVIRDAFGTTVEVDHGVVAVRCDGAREEEVPPPGPGGNVASQVQPGEVALSAGAHATCLPVSAAALLGRAYAQRTRGDATVDVLATVDLARAALVDSGPRESPESRGRIQVAEEERPVVPADGPPWLATPPPAAGGGTPSSPLFGELALFESLTLEAAGRAPAALAAAEAGLAADPGTRRADLLRLAARLAVATGGCTRAAPHLDALAALGEPTPCSEP